MNLSVMMSQQKSVICSLSPCRGTVSLGVMGTYITHLGLRALREISDGDIVITRNPNLCYNSPDHWKRLFKSESQTVRPMTNGNSTVCGTDFTS